MDIAEVQLAGYLLGHFDIRQINKEKAEAEKVLWLAKWEIMNGEETPDSKRNYYLSNELVNACKIAIEAHKNNAKFNPTESKSARIDARQLKDKLDMVEIAERYTKLTGNGEKHGRCPIHGGDKHDAFYVSKEKQLGYCHTCLWRGDVFKLVMDMEQISFVEAVKRLSSG